MDNFWAAHNDETFWEKPEIFNPDRFLDEEGNFVRSPHVIPFSVEPRHCLGEQLARIEVFIFLMSILLVDLNFYLTRKGTSCRI